MVELDIEKEKFISRYTDFSVREQVNYPNGGVSLFFDNGKDAVIIDYEICNHKDGEPVFSYMLITDKQNSYVHEYNRIFRFLGYDQQEMDKYLLDNKSKVDVEYSIVANREEQANVSPLELHFEKSFTNAYGMNALKYLSREYCISDESGKNYFLDYLVRTQDGKYAVEENGVTYHHPQLIGETKYREQLIKQNTCTLWGIKLYRFSTEDCAFDRRIEDDIKLYFGENSDSFVNRGISASRGVELYEHQSLSLKEIQRRREAGIKAFLVVFPTAAGKSRIVEEDICEFAKSVNGFKGLILVPGTDILHDWQKRIEISMPDMVSQIDVCTYAYMARHYTEYNAQHYNYMVVDEAHHAVAPVLKRVIQYFNPDFTIGLTATDQRPDKKKLESVFGSYETSLSLKDAMDKGIVAQARVYRIETNIDLSKVRFNGNDYINADLEKSIRVISRNELIVNVLNEYFTEGEAAKRQGVIFCVNVSHANEMARLLNKAGVSAYAYTGESKNPQKIMEDFKEKKIRFLCACNMLSEGWDYPELGILVMARPTLSKVLYLQQIGRGLRKTDIKKDVFIIDVVDEYGAMARPCSMHALFANPYYVPWGEITKSDYKPGDMIIIDGLEERVERIMKVDINSFEEKYGDYLSQEQLAREYFVSTGTITSWIKKKKIIPSVEYDFGSKSIYMFSPEDVERYRAELNIKVHDDTTIKEDFFDFLEERDYSLSYKMPFMLSFIAAINSIGDAEINTVLNGYIAFYKDRLVKGFKVDRPTCPYNETTLEDRGYIRSNMLTNPFEKFERKRFLYYSKDLGVISMNHALFSQMNNDDWERVRKQMQEDLEDYYRKL